MKLLIVIPALGAVYGGTSKCVVELAQALGNLGITVDLVATNANGSEVIEAPMKTWLPKTNYRLQFFPYKGMGDYKFSFSLSKWLYQHIGDYDLVQTNAIFSVPNLAAYWACQWYNIPYVIIPHGMLDPWALSYKGWKKRIYYNLLEKPALQNASALQMLASTEAEQIKPLKLKTPVTIAPNGIHRQDFEQLPNPELFYQQFPATRNKTLILFLGRIDPKKGLDLLATAFGKIHSKFSDTHLILAGPDNIGFLPTAKDYFANAGCLDAVTFTGMLTGSLKYAALAAASIYVAPSYSEGFSMSVLEGMASGLPCVITTGCNFPEAATAKVAHVVDIDAEAIANALSQCLQFPQQAKEMGTRARQLIFEQYTWDSIAKKLIQVYKSIIQNQPISILS
ncbi:MAG: glycosyltransferase [Moorea sp. SIO1F2]|uniref:glycosyltransferase n=1 Tax=Moorena sp. SIO1F2 TaxID=2607819 RepID=UPI0013B9EE3B|nr:glycosyltransferase [Moorena sp. SIO1F2]NET86035.1 glycosyltransferase [Moorena sp. SIO1F2]